MENRVDAARTLSCLAAGLALSSAGCATTLRGEPGGEGVQAPEQTLSVPGPGAPRVRVEVARKDSLDATVELQEVTRWELAPVNLQGPGGGARGSIPVPVGRLVCGVPCDQVIDGRRGQEFFFTGARLTDSEHFKLADESGELFFTVKPGESNVWSAGSLFSVVGGGGVAGGTTVLLLGLALGPSENMVKTGAVALGAGAGVLGLGIAMMLIGKTTYQVRRVAPAAR